MNKDLEHLIQQLKDAPDNPTVDLKDNSVLNFILNNNIKPGNHKVTAAILYKLYKAKTKLSVTKNVFTRKLNEILVPQCSGGKWYYCINKEASNIANEAYELLDRSTRHTKLPSYQKYFNSFIEAYQIKPGTTFIEGFLIYELYLKYCRRRHKRPLLGRNQMHDFLMIHFRHKRVTKNRSLWFGVNEDIVKHFQEGEIDAIRESRKNSKKEGRSQESSN